MKFENVLKGVVTTLLGLAMMIFAFYGWYFLSVEEALSDWQALGLLLMGFILCFVRLKMEETLSKILGDFPAMLWKKVFGEKKEQNPPL